MREERKRTGAPEAGLLLVILASICYVCLLAGGNPEVFLIDDNRTQWYPVMERAYEDLWTAGRIYCYDFYQMKGMSVAGPTSTVILLQRLQRSLIYRQF